MKIFLRRFAFLVVALVAALGINYASAAWTAPTVAPPGGNISVPINIGNVAQAKTGTISTVDFYSGYSSSRYNFQVNSAGVASTTGVTIYGNPVVKWCSSTNHCLGTPILCISNTASFNNNGIAVNVYGSSVSITYASGSWRVQGGADNCAGGVLVI